MVGDSCDTSLLEEVPGGSARTKTPLLFIDAESFLADTAWWRAKETLVKEADAAETPLGSALVSLRGSSHHTFSGIA